MSYLHPLPVSCPLALSLLSVGLIGCGESPSRKTGNLSGTVTFRQVPLTTGIVTLYDDAGKPISIAPISSKGTYRFLQTPAGLFRVGVESPPPMGARGGPPAPKEPDGETLALLKLAAQYVPIPLKYKDPAQSGLSVDIKPGKNANTKFEIALVE